MICLQEVQANHFDKFFHPQLSKAGYDGLFKAKTRTDAGSTFTGQDGGEGNFMVATQEHTNRTRTHALGSLGHGDSPRFFLFFRDFCDFL